MAYGVVEFNHMSAQKTGQIKAQAEANVGLKTAVSNMLQNGLVLVYDETVDPAVVRVPVDGDSASDLMLHKSAEKLYNKYENELGDFVLDLTGNVLPRMYKLNSGDTYTVTTEILTSGLAFGDLSVGDTLYADVEAANGTITNAADDGAGTSNIAFAKVAKKTTAPNGSDDAIKVVVL